MLWFGVCLHKASQKVVLCFTESCKGQVSVHVHVLLVRVPEINLGSKRQLNTVNFAITQ
jgi:hypothetical protein